MLLTEVNSSNIRAIGHEDNNLIVQYKSGVKYLYENVSTDTFNELLNAESKGSFMNKNIKNKYPYRKLVD